MAATIDGKPMTERQLRIYGWIFDFTCKRGFQPTMREMMDHFGMTSPNGMLCHLKSLRDKGWIKLSENHGKPRALRFLKCPDGTSFRGFKPR